MNESTVRGRRRRQFAALTVISALVAFGGLGVSAPASAQTDPYTSSSVPRPPVIGQPLLSIDDSIVVVGQRLRVQGCFFLAGAFIRITLNPGDQASPGTRCPGAQQSALGASQVLQRAGVGATGLEQVRFEPLAAQVAPCPFNQPTNAGPPDTTAGGGIASTRADGGGCVDTFVTVPNVAPGTYQLCAVPVGQQSACAVLRIVSATGAGAAAKGFARTGLTLLPWVLGALAAIVTGRILVRRSRRYVRA